MKLMNLGILLSALFLLSACSTTGDTTEDASGADVAVEDRNAQSSGIDSDSASGEAFGDGSEAQVIADSDQYQGENAINDPSSPLYNRVVYFEYDSSTVRPEDLITLEAHAAYLGEHPNVTIRLQGHTDERGSREYNLALGERRAISVRQILMLQGAGVNQFEVTSYGEERPEMQGYDDSSWQQNRRVELIYIGR